MVWNEKTYTEDEWRHQIKTWEELYPNISLNDDDAYLETAVETASYMKYQVSKPSMRECCYNSLAEIAVEELRHCFRVDIFGNIISLQAQDNSICAFDVAHLFPWCRGGRSVKQNFTALQSDANRLVKGLDRFTQSLSRGEMQQFGIVEDQMVALIEYAKLSCNGDRRLWHYERFQIINWLTSHVNKNAKEKDAKSKRAHVKMNFQNLVAGSRDGRYIYACLSKHFESC